MDSRLRRTSCEYPSTDRTVSHNGFIELVIDSRFEAGLLGSFHCIIKTRAFIDRVAEVCEICLNHDLVYHCLIKMSTKKHEIENSLGDLEPDLKKETQGRQERHRHEKEYETQPRLLPVTGSAASDLERTTSPPLL